MHRGRDVGGEGPRGSGPDQQRLAVRVGQRQAHVHRGVGHLLVPLGDDFVLRQAGAAARAPGHRVGASVEPAVLVAALQEMPDGVVVLIRHGVVGVVPVHPVAEAPGLFGLDRGVLAHPLLALLHEAGDAVGLDVALGGEALLLLHLHFDPQPLAVEPVLVTLAIALHGAPAQEQVLVGAAPGVVHPHRVVGGDRTVDEGVAPLGRGVALQVAIDDAGGLPPAELLMLQGDEVDARRYGGKYPLGAGFGGHGEANLSPAWLPGQGAPGARGQRKLLSSTMARVWRCRSGSPANRRAASSSTQRN